MSLWGETLAVGAHGEASSATGIGGNQDRAAHGRSEVSKFPWYEKLRNFTPTPPPDPLAAFGAPLHQLEQDDLASPDMVFQIGVAPVRIDILTTIDGVEFDDAWAERIESHYSDQSVHVLSKAHLIRNKTASGRLQDLADVEHLGNLHSDKDG